MLDTPWILVIILSCMVVGLIALLTNAVPYQTLTEDQVLKSKSNHKSNKAADQKSSGSVSAGHVANLIKSRRSVFPKDYNGQAVPSETIDMMLESANWAPTHGYTEPWRFVVITGDMTKKFLDVVNQEALKTVEKGSEAEAFMLKKQARKAKEKAKCSHLIAVCMKRVKGKKGKLMPEWEDTASVACAVQNMHLVATAAGVAAYWSSGGVGKALASPAVRDLLGLTGEGDKCLGLFHVGMSDKIERYRGSRQPWQEKITWLTGNASAAEKKAA